jgi:hypothetical protein
LLSAATAGRHVCDARTNSIKSTLYPVPQFIQHPIPSSIQQTTSNEFKRQYRHKSGFASPNNQLPTFYTSTEPPPVNKQSPCPPKHSCPHSPHSWVSKRSSHFSIIRLTNILAFGATYTTVVARGEGNAIDNARTRWQQQKMRGDSAMSEAGARWLREHEEQEKQHS